MSSTFEPGVSAKKGHRKLATFHRLTNAERPTKHRPYPCRCCDGPGPADCVICPAGFACIDSDEDGAGQCMEGEEGSNVCDGPGGSAQDYRPGPEDEEFPEDEGDSPWSDDQESDFLEDQEGAVPPDDDEVEFVEDQEDGLASDDHGSEDFIDDQDNQPAAHDEM
ncbi:unnamed protein product [Effrenium voratum]|nr:unnamed protein product [Effrenium voratum]